MFEKRKETMPIETIPIDGKIAGQVLENAIKLNPKIIKNYAALFFIVFSPVKPIPDIPPPERKQK